VSLGDVCGAVPPASEAEQRSPLLMLVDAAHLAVVGLPQLATESERAATEALAQENVQSHVGVVRMHVETGVLINLRT
tara:strand:+ start:796 stop:1029 length:234 start_codon:yes stop_codon:yes gene_type:complete